MWVGLDVHSCNNPDMHNIRQQRFAYSSVHSLFRSILHLQHEMHILQAMNAAEVWQWGYRSIHFLAQYSLSPLLGWPCLAKNKAQVKWRCGSFWQAMAVNFGFGVGTCMGTFKQLFHATAHPLVVVLELPWDNTGVITKHAIALTWYTLGGRTFCSLFFLVFFPLLFPFLPSFFL